MSEHSDALNELAAFCRATGMVMSDNVRYPGLWLNKAGPGRFVVIERVGPGLVTQQPLGTVQVTLGQLQAATRFARAFGLTTNVFGERSVVQIEDEARRTELLLHLNSAGAALQEIGDAEQRVLAKVYQALGAVIAAKELVQKHVVVKE